MAILTAETRRRLKDSDFAVPGERKYPIHNVDHAKNALSRVSEFGSPEEKKQVKAAVHKKYPALAKNDPDMDGDDDSTAAGDTDHDVFAKNGKKMDKMQMSIQKMWKK